MAGRSGRTTRPPGPWRTDHPPPRGNLLALRHGGNSERVIAARAELVHRELLALAPYLDEDKFLPAVRRYLAAAAREELLDDHIRKVSAEKGPGAVPPRVWEQATAAARLAAKLGQDLGLDPIGHARIRALSVAADATEATLTDLEQRGRQVIEARADREAAASPQERLEPHDGTEEAEP